MEPKTVPVGAEGTEVNGGGSGSEAHHEQLIANIPDDFTLKMIVPKLPWKSLWSLASRSTAWGHVTRNREVYNARVIYRALESLVLLRFGPNRIGLYSTRDGFYSDLPPLPIPELTIGLYPRLPPSVCSRGIPYDCECVTLNGKLYALGGNHLDHRHVYALDLAAMDLAGPTQWKQCASMLQQKSSFACVALHGKVYAFQSHFTNVESASEVYDPKADTWSLIERMPDRQCLRLFEYPPIAVGDELVIFCVTARVNLNFQMAFSADVYHPLKDEWRVVKPVQMAVEPLVQNFFTAKGKLFRMRDGIFALDLDTGRWTLRHRYSFAGLGFLHEDRYKIQLVTVVGDELVAIVQTVGAGNPRGNLDEVWVLESEGFGGTNIDISWHETELCPSDRGSRSSRPIPFQMHPIEL